MKGVFDLVIGLALHRLGNDLSVAGKDFYDLDSMKSRLTIYKKHAKVLRQINSDKMERCRALKNRLDISIFVFTVILTFFGFYGIDKIQEKFLSWVISVDLLQLLFNIIILCVLVLSAIQMSARLGEKQVQHFGTVQRLTDFITDVDDVLIVTYLPANEIRRTISDFNQKYKGITSSLPENSDAEWSAAKKKMAEKKKLKEELEREEL